MTARICLLKCRFLLPQQITGLKESNDTSLIASCQYYNIISRHGIDQRKKQTENYIFGKNPLLFIEKNIEQWSRRRLKKQNSV